MYVASFLFKRSCWFAAAYTTHSKSWSINSLAVRAPDSSTYAVLIKLIFDFLGILYDYDWVSTRLLYSSYIDELSWSSADNYSEFSLSSYIYLWGCRVLFSPSRSARFFGCFTGSSRLDVFLDVFDYRESLDGLFTICDSFRLLMDSSLEIRRLLCSFSY